MVSFIRETTNKRKIKDSNNKKVNDVQRYATLKLPGSEPVGEEQRVRVVNCGEMTTKLRALYSYRSLLPDCANGPASVSEHQLVVSALALDVQRLFDFPSTPFLLIVNDLRTIPRNFVAGLDHMLCDRRPLRTLLLYKRSSRFCSVSPMYTASHSIQGTL